MNVAIVMHIGIISSTTEAQETPHFFYAGWQGAKGGQHFRIYDDLPFQVNEAEELALRKFYHFMPKKLAYKEVPYTLEDLRHLIKINRYASTLDDAVDALYDQLELWIAKGKVLTIYTPHPPILDYSMRTLLGRSQWNYFVKKLNVNYINLIELEETIIRKYTTDGEFKWMEADGIIRRYSSIHLVPNYPRKRDFFDCVQTTKRLTRLIPFLINMNQKYVANGTLDDGGL